MTPRLSILMGSVGDRLDRMCSLYGELARQAAPFGDAVEILVLTDNRQRSIGLKRQALLDVSRGEYVCFVDDDDGVSPAFIEAFMFSRMAAHPVPDVFVFPTMCSSEEYGEFRVEHSVGYENEDADVEKDSFRRKPWFMHPIHRNLATTSRFPDKSWGEDSGWLRPLWEKMITEVSMCEEPLYFYKWEDSKPNEDKP